MKLLSGISFLLCFFIPALVSAQYKISGKITEVGKGKPAKRVDIYVNTSLDLWQGDDGAYVLSNVPNGTYDIAFFSYDYKTVKRTVVVNDKDVVLNIQLESLTENLSEVIIQAHRKELFGMTRLKDVQGVAIYAGKKSEVILLENTLANLATNNARQIYAKVAGLNIWESDGSGLQLGIGGRGLDPNRTANFNVRQNGYDISADALGYPESYYTPPTEALERIEIVRGAASLQYGTQFGGLLNFKIKAPVKNKSFSFVSRQSVGSFGLFNTFNNISGTADKFSYNAYVNYKRGDGWRPNSDFEQWNLFADLRYQMTPKSSIRFEVTHMDYLAHQPGGLSDAMFADNPKQSNRSRNWFNVNWNLLALHFDHKFSDKTKINARIYTLDAFRKVVGYRSYRPENTDPVLLGIPAERELIVGEFKTFGTEVRALHHYNLFNESSTVLLGARYYKGNNTSEQGLADDGYDADFKFINIDDYITQTFTDEININTSSYKYPNTNVAVFGENIFKLSESVSVTPGFRFEYINTKANGDYRIIRSNQAGDIVFDNTVDENESLKRHFVLLGLGTSYKPTDAFELYANISQNYRSVTFSDIRIVNPNSLVDPDIKDEEGYSVDLGIRGNIQNKLRYDITGFYLNYDDRLGDILAPDPDNGILKRIRTNVGKATIYGVESLLQWQVLSTLNFLNEHHSLELFANTSFVQSEYTAQYYANATTQIKGNQVEFVPELNLKTGIQYAYKAFGASIQYTYLSKQFTDATNALAEGGTGTIGEIPAYSIMDLSLSYKYKNWKLETGVNNLLDASYFTRRATGYPGPGIIPSDARSFYVALQFKL